MVSDGVYCENQKEILFQVLLSAMNNVKIAVAWINFDDYYPIFCDMLQRNVKISVAVNDDIKNKRHLQIINDLIQRGLKIKFIKMPSATNYMHHKFCIIDDCACMMGSFNWTKNANDNNYEDLTLIHDMNLVRGYNEQFSTVWNLSTDDLRMLKKPECCERCGQPIAYLCVFEQEGFYQTKADIYRVCGCIELQYVSSEFFDITVYNTVIGIFDKYNDMDESDSVDGFEWNKEERQKQMDTEIAGYLSSVRCNRMGFPIIYAVGLYGWKWFNKHDGTNIIQVLWKERYASRYILNEYFL